MAVDGSGATDNVFDYAEASHPFLGSVQAGATNVQMLKVAVATTGPTNPLEVTTMTFDANGLTNTEITNAKLYFTEQTNTFSTTNLLATLTAPIGNQFDFTFNAVEVPHGINYF